VPTVEPTKRQENERVFGRNHENLHSRGPRDESYLTGLWHKMEKLWHTRLIQATLLISSSVEQHYQKRIHFEVNILDRIGSHLYHSSDWGEFLHSVHPYFLPILQ
jgi:hypothetical protein